MSMETFASVARQQGSFGSASQLHCVGGLTPHANWKLRSQTSDSGSIRWRFLPLRPVGYGVSLFRLLRRQAKTILSHSLHDLLMIIQWSNCECHFWSSWIWDFGDIYFDLLLPVECSVVYGFRWEFLLTSDILATFFSTYQSSVQWFMVFGENFHSPVIRRYPTGTQHYNKRFAFFC